MEFCVCLDFSTSQWVHPSRQPFLSFIRCISKLNHGPSRFSVTSTALRWPQLPCKPHPTIGVQLPFLSHSPGLYPRQMFASLAQDYGVLVGFKRRSSIYPSHRFAVYDAPLQAAWECHGFKEQLNQTLCWSS